MIARTWRGKVASGRGRAYMEVVAATGLLGSRGTPGNLGFYVMQRPAGDHDEILTVSLWASEDAVRAFAGDDITRAVFYPEDDAWLIGRDLHADHWEVVGEAGIASGSSAGDVTTSSIAPTIAAASGSGGPGAVDEAAPGRDRRPRAR